jgi:hypothetical protein
MASPLSEKIINRNYGYDLSTIASQSAANVWWMTIDGKDHAEKLNTLHVVETAQSQWGWWWSSPKWLFYIEERSISLEAEGPLLAPRYVQARLVWYWYYNHQTNLLQFVSVGLSLVAMFSSCWCCITESLPLVSNEIDTRLEILQVTRCRCIFSIPNLEDGFYRSLELLNEGHYGNGINDCS